MIRLLASVLRRTLGRRGCEFQNVMQFLTLAFDSRHVNGNYSSSGSDAICHSGDLRISAH